MSQEKVFKTLAGLGLTRLDAQVYIYLSKRGPQRGKDISKALKTQKQQLYRSLKSLQSKGIVNSTLERPARFSAVNFDKVVDIFVKAKMAEAQQMQENMAEILANWQAITLDESSDITAKFNVIEGRGPVFAKILQMMKEAQIQLSTVFTVRGLIRANQFGVFDDGLASQVQPKIRFRAITELSQSNIELTKNLLRELDNPRISFEGRTPELSLRLPQLLIRDEEEILFFITPSLDVSAQEHEDMVLWTNCKSLVQAFSGVFENIWQNSTGVETKILELETGKPAISKSFLIKDAQLVHDKYEAVLSSAKREVIFVTSAEALMQLNRSRNRLEDWIHRGISVRIMAPITSKNIAYAQQMSKNFDIRHVPEEYIGTTLVDGEHLFQFKNPPTDFVTKTNIENTFYTNDVEYVEKTRTMLNDIWKNAQTPSFQTLKSVTTPTVTPSTKHVVYEATKKMLGYTATRDEEVAGQLTERSTIDRIIKAKRDQPETNPEVVTWYGTNSQAVIHPPKNLNLPDMLLHTYHMDKNSTFGAEESMVMHVRTNTPQGYFYIPSAVITTNLRSRDFFKKICSNTPAADNIQLVKEDQFETRFHGNTVFAAWAVEIPLLDQYRLPPACLQIEGYGSIITNAYDAHLPSGYTFKTQGNILEAFVTFYLPSLRYSGPGTDAAFGRDIIIEWHPPQELI